MNVVGYLYNQTIKDAIYRFESNRRYLQLVQSHLDIFSLCVVSLFPNYKFYSPCGIAGHYRFLKMSCTESRICQLLSSSLFQCMVEFVFNTFRHVVDPVFFFLLV